MLISECLKLFENGGASSDLVCRLLYNWRQMESYATLDEAYILLIFYYSVILRHVLFFVKGIATDFEPVSSAESVSETDCECTCIC